jgi:hypothetical protein
MTIETSSTSDSVQGGVARKVGFSENAEAHGVFTVTCYDSNGNQKWVDIAPNLVVNVGLQDMNTQYFRGSTYTAAWYIGLIDGNAASTTYSGGDTLASHAGWTENTSYSGNRKAVTFGAATLSNISNINNAGSVASFTMNATANIAGAFLANVATGTSGLLFSEADFQAPGDRSVVNGDVINVTYSFNLSS